MTSVQPNTWRVPRESKEWVGPIAITITVDGEPVEVDPTKVKLAVLQIRTRPTDADWTDPVPEPGGTALIGLQADPVDNYQELGIWIQISDSAEIPVLEPDEVGYLTRT